MKGFLGGVLFTLLALAVTVVGIAWSGAANVGATETPAPTVDWFLETTRENAIEEGAEEIRENGGTPHLDDPELLAGGIRHFREYCITCHGAPGVAPAEFARGMRPEPPDLSQVDHTPEELFWIVRHGIGMTGMPAFGPTHSDEELWSMVAFVRRLPAMTATDFRKRLRAEGLTMPERGHGHEEPGEGERETTGSEGGE